MFALKLTTFTLVFNILFTTDIHRGSTFVDNIRKQT